MEAAGPERQYEIRDEEYMDAVNSGDMETAQRMVDQAAKDAGYTIRGEHGTVAKYFTVFDRAKTSDESYWGRGFYFSSNHDDVMSNYANSQGADLQYKIQSTFDLYREMSEYKDVSNTELMKMVNDRFTGGEPRVIRAALRMNNPLIVTTNSKGSVTGKTDLDYNTRFPEFIRVLKEVLA